MPPTDPKALIAQARECAETLDPIDANGRDILWAIALLPELADALEAALRELDEATTLSARLDYNVRRAIARNKEADSGPTVGEILAALGDSDGE